MTGRMLSEKTGGIGWMTFSNPTKRNAMSLEMWGAMAEIVQDFQADPAIRVVVMQGDGDKAFVSGADISQFEKSRADAEAAAAYSAVSDGARAALNDFDKPLIALIRGFCMGGGLGIAMTADLRFAASDAKFGIPAANLGIAYSQDNLRRLVGLVGPSVAKDILFSARRLDAEEALRVGLVNRVAAPEALEEVVRSYAATLAEKAPLSQRASKAIVNELMKPESEQDSAMMRGHVETCFNSADYTEGRRAFMEKRPPVFQGH
jgi:enoyl-CoA hydratase/carnithine racemase